MWRVCKAAGRPFPSLDSDEVVDYLIAEAVATKIAKEDQAAAKKAEVKKWQSDHSELENFR